jgi:hypothetical protein
MSASRLDKSAISSFIAGNMILSKRTAPKNGNTAVITSIG